MPVEPKYLSVKLTHPFLIGRKCYAADDVVLVEEFRAKQLVKLGHAVMYVAQPAHETKTADAKPSMKKADSN